MIPFMKKNTARILGNAKAKMYAKTKTAAFTLIELLVVLGIFGIIMTTALANQQELNSTLLISNLAYEIGMITRETQAYGIGVRAVPGEATAQNFQGAFGMYIKLVDDGSGSTHKTADQIVIFKELDEPGFPADGIYTAGNPNELFSIYQFQNQRGNKITALCGMAEAGGCKSDSLSSSDEISIIFKRPNPEASFNFAYKSDFGALSVGEPGPAIIVVNTAARKNCRAVIIEATGQIRVESAQSAAPACANDL